MVGEAVTKGHLDTRLAELDTKLAELKLEMIRWIVSTVGAAAVGIVVTISPRSFEPSGSARKLVHLEYRAPQPRGCQRGRLLSGNERV